MYEEKDAIAAGGKLLPSERGVKGKGLLIVTFSLSVESYSIKFFGHVNPTTF